MEWYALNCIDANMAYCSFIGAIQIIAISGLYIFDFIRYLRKPLK